jgi:flagellar biosynthesis/type III secretory pathway M-ring protein FliF/YscJ
MEFISKYLVQIRETLKNLTISQKMLIMMLLVVMGAAMFWMVSYTSKPQMVALIEQNMTDAEIGTMENRLDQWDIYYTVEGGKILVRRQERDRLLARLGQISALPTDMAESWKKMVLEDNTMWLPQEDRMNRWKLALEQRLAQIIKMMDDVATANVIINSGSKRLLSDGPSSDPSASVSIIMNSGTKPTKAFISAVASLVAGSVDRLALDRVFIIANGVSYRAPKDDSMFAADELDTKRENEKYYSDKIQSLLGINNALVGVFVELETETISTQQETYKDPVVSKETNKEENSNQNNSAGEPGVRPNTGQSIPTEQVSGEKTSKNETETEYQGKRDTTIISKRNSPGTVKSIRATVNIPMSYFAEVFKQQTGKTEKPSAVELTPIITVQSEKIRKKILPAIGATDASLVEVSEYHDNPTLVSGAPVLAGTTGSLTLPPVMEMVKPAGLGILAISSLLMVLMMLKKASANVSVSNLERILPQNEPPPPLDTESQPVGEAGSTEGILQGIEVDEGTLRTLKMSEQVASMVKEDPVSSASLVKQWIVKDR